MKYFITLLLILCSYAAYIFIREKALEEYRPPELRFKKYQQNDSVLTLNDRFRKSSVIVFDIADLVRNTVNDSASSPEFFDILKSSRVYSSTVDLTPDRVMCLKSFLGCLSPYKFNDRKEPYRKLKDIISDSLRNGSVPQAYARSGYITRLYTADSAVFLSASGYFSKSVILKSKEEVLEQLYKDIIKDKDTLFFCYADLSGDRISNENYFTDIDNHAGLMRRMIENRIGIEPLMLFVSTNRTNKFSKGLSFFHQKGMKHSNEAGNAAMTDISKTLLSYSKVIPPGYFGGYDLDNDEEFIERDYFAGSCSDTLMLFNGDYIYKQLKYSPEYYYYDRRKMADVTNSYIGINEKFGPLLSKYFGGDYAKVIILKNNGEKLKNFRIGLRSNRRFEDFRTITGYYKAEKKNGKYSKDLNIELEPGKTDTLFIYYSHIYQNFDFSFGDKSVLSYGSTGINAGAVKNFEENSYYGMKYYYAGDELLKNYDIRIYNIRINY